jgi:HD superfamily phosphohydrolase
MLILAGLLRALGRLHDAGLVHRDVKDANVMYEPESGAVTLIDFGFAKRAGMAETVTDDSFLRAGAPRFSPPGKLDHPARAEKTDDVFAAGVVAYRLLTAEYPWEAGQRQALDALRTAMRNRPLVPVHERNSRVLRAASQIVSDLLTIEDYARPTAEQGLQAVRLFLETVRRQQGEGRIRRAARLRYPKRIRDPLYGDVRMTTDEWRVLDTPEIQRLRSLKQLGLTNLIYPGATHSRLSHAIGRLARIEQILLSIEQREGTVVDETLRRAARLFALTYDVTQIPFGNTIEDELGFYERHDRNERRAERVLAEQTEFASALREVDGGGEVLAHLRGGEDQSLVRQLVTGPWGADVLDYVNRDAFFCGLDDRIDSAVLRQFQMYEADRFAAVLWDKYGLRVDREYAVESVLRTRYALFLKVYTNRSKSAASVLLDRALTAAIHPAEGKPQLTEEALERHNDDSLLWYLCGHEWDTIRAPADRLRRRKLPRGAYRGVLVSDPADPHAQARRDRDLMKWKLLKPLERRAREAEIADAARVDAGQVMIHCPARAPGYRLVDYWVSPSSTAEPQEGKSLTELQQKHLGLWELWVFVDPDLSNAQRAAVARESQRRFGMANVIDVHHQEGR